ncbi:phage terminase small subunit P27 family [Nitrosomonas sp.]|uniref:phage terminase small subunit P27 family n=1 Tax=Nitrosomonas sp. TaxID=42353 RepID=UPI0025CF11C7|nr:phage terminase small subunit P27 family [Nitrosomonas sp.]
MGQRGPKPLPDNVHALRGNPSKKNLGDILGGVHPSVEIPNCPPHLVSEAKKEYKRITAELKVLGLISNIDRGAIAAYCSAWAEIVHCESKISELNKKDPKGEAGLVGITPNGYQQMSVWVQIRNRAYERMMRFASEFGMSPSSRTKATPSENQQSLPGFEDQNIPKTGWNAL